MRSCLAETAASGSLREGHWRRWALRQRKLAECHFHFRLKPGFVGEYFQPCYYFLLPWRIDADNVVQIRYQRGEKKLAHNDRWHTAIDSDFSRVEGKEDKSECRLVKEIPDLSEQRIVDLEPGYFRRTDFQALTHLNFFHGFRRRR